MKYILLLSIISNATYQEPNSLIVIILNKEECPLSRKVEKWLKNKEMRNQKINIYYAQNHMEFAKLLGTKYLPTIYKLKKINGKWYKDDTFDPSKRKLNLDSILSFIRDRVTIRPQFRIPSGMT